MDATIKRLRAFFSITNAAFDLLETMFDAADSLDAQLSKMPPKRQLTKEVHDLHKAALKELEKESPDLSVIDGIMFEMERIAQRNALEKQKSILQKFKPGGISSNHGKENEL